MDIWERLLTAINNTLVQTHTSQVRGEGGLSSPPTAFFSPRRPATAADAGIPAAPGVPVNAPLRLGPPAAVAAVQVAREETAAAFGLCPQEGLLPGGRPASV